MLCCTGVSSVRLPLHRAERRRTLCDGGCRPILWPNFYPRVSNLLPSMRAGPRTRPLQMFAVFRRGFHRCHADVCRRWSMGRPGGVRAFPSLAGNVCRHPPSPPVVGMFSFPAAPLTTFFCGGAVVLAVVRLHSAGACAAPPGNPRKKQTGETLTGGGRTGTCFWMR